MIDKLVAALQAALQGSGRDQPKFADLGTEPVPQDQRHARRRCARTSRRRSTSGRRSSRRPASTPTEPGTPGRKNAPIGRCADGRKPLSEEKLPSDRVSRPDDTSLQHMRASRRRSGKAIDLANDLTVAPRSQCANSRGAPLHQQSDAPGSRALSADAALDRAKYASMRTRSASMSSPTSISGPDAHAVASRSRAPASTTGTPRPARDVQEARS